MKSFPTRLLPMACAVALACGGTTPDEGAFATGSGDTGGVDGAIGSSGGGADSGAASDAGSTGDGGGEAVDSGSSQVDGGGKDAGASADSGSSTKGKHPCELSSAGLFTKLLDVGGSGYGRGVVAAGCGLVIAGRSGDSSSKTRALLVHACSNGAVKWTRTYGLGLKQDEVEAVIAYQGAKGPEGYVLVGGVRSKSNGSADGWLIRTDLDGKELWQQHYGGDSIDEGRGVVQAADGGLVFAGMTRSSGNGQEAGWLVAVDKDGKAQWQKTYGGTSIDEFYGMAGVKGGYAMVGETWSKAAGKNDAWLVVTDASGTATVDRNYGGQGQERFYAAREYQGGLILAGKSSPKLGHKMWVMRANAAGDVMWSRDLGGTQSQDAHDIAVTADGTIHVVGNTYVSASGRDAWLLALDPWGNVQLDRKFGGKGNQWGRGLIVHDAADGRRTYLVAGDAWEGKAKVLFAKLDEHGLNTCDFTGKCGALKPGACDDGNPCTADGCDPAKGCTHEALKDGAVCGDGKVCAKSVCQ